MIVRPILCRPFIGRREELAYLNDLRRAAGASKGGLVLVTGEAGLGKSRLLNELCASLAYSRYRVGRGACTQFAGRPYAPVLDALARLEGERRELVPAASQREQIESIVARFAALAARTALIVTVEDLHWADAATLDLLAHLAPALRRMRALVVVTLRPDALQAGHPAYAGTAKIARAQAGRIDLAPLGGNDLRTFIAEALGETPLSEDVRRRIARLSEGNPFFTEELLQSAVAHESARHAGDAAPVPPTIRAALLERLAAFDAHERRVIAQAAVIGRTFSLELLATTLAVPAAAVLAPLRRARDALLIEELGPAAFRFRHGLTRDAIYGDFLESELRPLHRTVARALESASETAAVERLAYHWWAAGDGERAARYNALAGDAASRLHAHEDAVGFYERALECTGAREPAARGALLEKIAESRLALTWTEDAWATFGAAADLFQAAVDDEREASCRVHAALLAYTTGKREPTAALEAMLARLPAEHYAARSRVHLGIAWLTATFGFPARAEEHLRGVDPRALAADDIALRVHNVAAWVAMTLGRLDDFRREHAAWLASAQAAGGVRGIVAARVNGAMCYAFFGLHDEAFAELDAALATAREANNAYALGLCRHIAVQCYFLAGDLARARAALATISPATESHVGFTAATAWGTLVGAYLGDRALIATWFDGFENAAGARALEIECGAGFAEIMVRRGRADDAARLLRSLLPRCDMVSGNVPTLLAVGRYGYTDDRALARTYLARAASAPAELPERAALALFDAWEHERAGRGTDAAACAHAAADGFARLRMPLFEAAARETAGDVAGALALYRRCGAAYEVTRLAGDPEPAAFRSPAGEAVPLSAREREIAARAARGLSNLQIARELAISHKTVEKHLASVYGKLGISSRRELTLPA